MCVEYISTRPAIRGEPLLGLGSHTRMHAQLGLPGASSQVAPSQVLGARLGSADRVRGGPVAAKEAIARQNLQ
jgi:hypothetical protein